jgi:hypothetical protein
MALLALVVGGSPTAPAPGPAAGPAPEPRLLAAAAGGTIVEVAPADGRVLGQVAGPERTGGPVASVTASLPAGALWFARHDPAAGLPCDADLVRLPLAGGPAEVVGRGFAPAVSPDGGRLAYVRTERRGSRCTYTLAVRSLDPGRGGHEEAWPLDEPWSSAYGICSVGWSPAGDRLLAEVCAEGDSVLHVLDPARPGPVGTPTFVGPGGWDRAWRAPAPGGGPATAVVVEVAACCPSGRGEVGARLRQLDLVPDRPAEGPVLAALPPGSPWVSALAAGPGGRLALVAEGPDGSTLLTWDGGGLRPLGTGFVAAAWA